MKVYRYPGVRPFQAADKALFFGRDRDIADLYEMVRAERLVVLFGKSGYGKSSLLNAGVLPRLAGVMTPVEVRLGEYIAGQSFTPVETVRRKAAVPFKIILVGNSEIGKSTLRTRLQDPDNPLPHKLKATDTFPADLPPSLWTHFKQLDSAEKGSYLLVFDQFEEFFSYPPEQQRDFRDQLADLLSGEMPEHLREAARSLDREQRRLLSAPMDIRVLFAIRSDRLHELDRLKDRLPAILHKRYELKALTREQAREAIVGPALLGAPNIGTNPGPADVKAETAENSSFIIHHSSFYSPPFEYREDALTKILNGLAVSNTTQQSGVEAFQLQILCDSIENKVAEGLIPDRDGNGLPDVTADDLPDFTEVFAQYYERRLALLPEAERTAARLVIEDGLVRYDPFTDEGRRLSVDGQALLKDYESAGLNPDLLRELENTFLVRREPNTLGGHNYELSHDTLLEPVVRAKKKRMAEEQMEALAAEEARIAREKADAQRRQRRARLTSFIAGILVMTATIAIRIAYMQSKTAKEAMKQTEKSISELKRTIDFSQDLMAKFDSQKIASNLQIDKAINLSQDAISLAEYKKKEAQKAAEQAVNALLTVATNAIKQLNYPEATEAVNTAVRLEAGKPEVAAALLEMAFFHNHTGDRKTAVRETATAARWLNRPDLAAQAERLAGDTRPLALRDVQKSLAPARFKQLDERYFPKMIPVKGGTFTPGCVKPDDDLCQQYNKDGLYRATVSDFELAETETTVWQYNLYALANGLDINQRLGPDGTKSEKEYAAPWGWIGDHPVVYVIWYDAAEYANWASEQQGLKPVYDIVKTERDPDNLNSNDQYRWLVRIREGADGYRLPTDAEWEFAARGGINKDVFKYAGSDDLDEVAWWSGNSGSRTHAVRSKKPNTLQLYDLSGNVWEWCWDWHGDSPEKPETNYRGLPFGEYRVLRGGSWYDDYIGYFRPADRIVVDPARRYLNYGFRVARH